MLTKVLLKLKTVIEGEYSLVKNYNSLVKLNFNIADDRQK